MHDLLEKSASPNSIYRDQKQHAIFYVWANLCSLCKQQQRAEQRTKFILCLQFFSDTPKYIIDLFCVFYLDFYIFTLQSKERLACLGPYLLPVYTFKSMVRFRSLVVFLPTRLSHQLQGFAFVVLSFPCSLCSPTALAWLNSELCLVYRTVVLGELWERGSSASSGEWGFMKQNTLSIPFSCLLPASLKEAAAGLRGRAPDRNLDSDPLSTALCTWQVTVAF